MMMIIIKKKKRVENWDSTCLPFLKPLRAFRVQFFDGNDHSRASSCRCQCLLIQPTLVDPSETTLTQQCVGFEALGRRFQVRETKHLQIWPFQNLAIWRRKWKWKWKRPFTTVNTSTRYLRKLAPSRTARRCREPHVLAVSTSWTCKQRKTQLHIKNCFRRRTVSMGQTTASKTLIPRLHPKS